MLVRGETVTTGDLLGSGGLVDASDRAEGDEGFVFGTVLPRIVASLASEGPESETQTTDEFLFHFTDDRFGGDSVVEKDSMSVLPGVTPLHSRDGVGVFGQHSVFGHVFPPGLDL